MEIRYKIILSNRNMYKEIELASDATSLKLGTSIDCDVRLRRELFFGQIELDFIKKNNAWTVFCSDNLYVSAGGMKKPVNMELKHGDELTIRYQDSNSEVFSLTFIIDFDNGKKRYERAIDISSRSEVKIGNGAGADIYINSKYVVQEDIKLVACPEGFRLEIIDSANGIYYNGTKIKSSTIIKNSDFFTASDFIFYYNAGFLWTEIRDDIFSKRLVYTDYPNKNNYPNFNRNTRVKIQLEDEKIEILDPPQIPKKAKQNLLTKFLPSIGMLLAAGVMAMLGSFTMLIFSGISVTMSIVVAIINMRDGNKEYEAKCVERIEKYNAYIYKKRQEIESARSQECAELNDIYISLERQRNIVQNFSPDLFDRKKDDEDFLCIRLGEGSVESIREINYKKHERLEVEDDLQLYPETICDEYKYVKRAPIVCNLKESNAIGIIGNEQNRFSLFKNIVVDISSRHYYTDVKMVFVTEEAKGQDIHWLRMLPHVYNDELGIRNIVRDTESKKIIFEYLYKELSMREQNKSYGNHVLVFFLDEYGFKSHPISKFTDKAMDLGFTFVFFSDTKSQIPLGCDYIVEVNSEYSGVLTDVLDKNSASSFHYTSISDASAEEIVNYLAPVTTEEISLEANLTKNYTMFEMLNIMGVDDLDLGNRWSNSKVFKSMAAPLGISKTGIVDLDLHDKAHGPHGLVAGTTGSGKSEILQSYILSMATLYHPHEVGFVIIDFKGGGMVNQFKSLPHLLGAITNIDGNEINRSLKSLKAELQKRQRYFAEYDVNHIDKYIQKYKSGEAKEALPHLIIIVDEFAELKAEQPEFMKELISAARIGRSLGVHLILATQKPSGQVNEQIWSNSRFKLCLKVQSKEDSNEVIKSPLAAEIKEAGRAYLQVGNDEIFELFQSAYSGASEKSDDDSTREFTIYELNSSGKKIPVYSQKKNKSGSSVTQLDAIVKYVDNYCKSKEIAKLSDICLASLESIINFPKTPSPISTETGYFAELGIYDDPNNQYQGEYSIDISAENLMIIGTAQSGKTNVLQNIIRSLASKYTPQEINIYVLDFGSMVLKNFENLNHVGGVVCSSEDEKLKNLFKLINTEIGIRKEKLVSVGVSSFSAYREAGKTDLSQMVIMIDNLTALKELYFQDDDELLKICREGLSVGISMIVANSHTSGIGYKYLSNFASRMALFCNDVNEYSSLFSHCSERIENIPGRCLVQIENNKLECQNYLAFEGEKEVDRILEIRKFVSETNAKNADMYARKIPLIPSSLTENYVVEEHARYMNRAFNLVSGYDYSSVSPFTIDFANVGLLAISGRDKSGKHNWLKYNINMLERMYPNKSEVYVIDGISKKMLSVKNKPNVVAYNIVAEEAISYIKEIEAKLKKRYEALAAGDEEILNKSPLLMLVVDNIDAVMAICGNNEALAAYKNIVGRYRAMNVCIIVSCIDNAPIAYSSPEILKNIRDQKHFMFFDDLQNLKIFDLPLSLVRNFKKPIERGDAYYIKDNMCRKLKTPLIVEN